MSDGGCGRKHLQNVSFEQYREFACQPGSPCSPSCEASILRSRIATLETEVTESRNDLDAALGDLNEIAGSLGIDLLTTGLRAKIHGLGLGVKGRIEELETALEAVVLDRKRITLAPTQAREARWVWGVSDEAMQKLDTARAAAKEPDDG